MQRDRESIYAYLQKLFYEYLNPPSEMASHIDGLIWKAAQELADEGIVVAFKDLPAQIQTDILKAVKITDADKNPVVRIAE